MCEFNEYLEGRCTGVKVLIHIPMERAMRRKPEHPSEACCDDWTSVFPQNSHVEILTSNVVVLEGRR